MAKAKLSPIDRAKRHGAHYAIKLAIEAGDLTRPEVCSSCGDLPTIVHGHHHKGYDLEHWLDIEWLCPSCHKGAHPRPTKAPSIQLSAWIRVELHEQLWSYATIHGLTLTAALEGILEHAFNASDPEKTMMP